MYCDVETIECTIYLANLVLSGVVFLGQTAIAALAVGGASVVLVGAYLIIEDGMRWGWRNAWKGWRSVWRRQA